VSHECSSPGSISSQRHRHDKTPRTGDFCDTADPARARGEHDGSDAGDLSSAHHHRVDETEPASLEQRLAAPVGSVRTGGDAQPVTCYRALKLLRLPQSRG
jgi:hypothetical protein